MEHLNGAFNEFVHRLIRTSLDILLNQLFQLGLEVNGHRGTISRVGVAVNFMMAGFSSRRTPAADGKG